MIQCSQCGGDNDLPSGRRLFSCRFCDAALFVDRSGVVLHYRLAPLLDADAARSALRRWMAGNETVKDLDRKSEILDVRLLSFPMWLFRAREKGTEQVHVEPAAPTPIPQLADLKVPAGELEAFRVEAEGVESPEATIPQETARGWLRQRGIESVTETALVQVPLWRCRYRFSGEEYQALVEASTGTVLASVFPEKAETPYYLVAVLGLILFGIEGLLISSPVVKAMAYAVTALPLTLLAYWVARKV